jgi:ubiquinol-cytochrome c reductase cytochrome c subunit
MTRLALIVAALTLVTASPSRAATQDGSDLYLQGCVRCHGIEGGGTLDGPPLRGVGAQAADFYLTTGYMPLDEPGDQPVRTDSPYSDAEIEALVEYVGAFGGPPVPRPRPERGSVSEGMRLFAENCAGCHQIVGEGGLVVGAVAPPLERSTPTQIAEVVRIGPYLMPRFTRRQLDDRQVDSIIRYVELTKDPDDRGGWGIGHLGPIPEGIVAWLLAGTVLVGTAVVIGGRAK